MADDTTVPLPELPWRSARPETMRRPRLARSLGPVAQAAALAGVLTVTIAACTAGASVSTVAPSVSTARPSQSGSMIPVSGIATAGPVCPVERPGDPGCAPRPVAHALLIVTGTDGSEVARVVTGPDGRFTLALPPGEYIVAARPIAGLIGTAPPVRFVVRAAGGPAPAPIHVDYDTGIR